MKNVFYALAFMLVGTFAFASTGEVEPIEDNSAIENVIDTNQNTLDVEFNCLFELSWDTDQHGQGSLWIDCGVTDDGPFDWSGFLDTILANFLDYP